MVVQGQGSKASPKECFDLYQEYKTCGETSCLTKRDTNPQKYYDFADINKNCARLRTKHLTTCFSKEERDQGHITAIKVVKRKAQECIERAKLLELKKGGKRKHTSRKTSKRASHKKSKRKRTSLKKQSSRSRRTTLTKRYKRRPYPRC